MKGLWGGIRRFCPGRSARGVRSATFGARLQIPAAGPVAVDRSLGGMAAEWLEAVPGGSPEGSGMGWLSESEQRVWRQLLKVETRLTERLDAELRAGHSLSLAEYEVLVHLSEATPEGLRMSELAERLVMSRSGLTRRVDSLERAGLVARRPCEADGRGSLAALTVLGAERVAEAAPTHVRGVRRYLLDALEDMAALAATLARIDAALGDG